MNKNYNQTQEFDSDLDLDSMEGLLSAQLEAELSDLSLLEEEREKIGNPEALGKAVSGIVWEQFMNNIATVAGEDFIRDNRGLTLDLRDEAHIQTTENFANGKIASHNDKIDFQKRFDDWQDNFQKNEDGTIKTNSDNPNYRGGKPDQKILVKDARAPFDKDRPKGSAAVHKDHTVSAAEIIRDPAANAHLDKQEQINFANSEKNLGDLDASANMSKGDSSMTEWLDSEHNGEKPADRFNIDEDELRERDKIAREEYEKIKAEGEKKSIETGKQSQKEEALRISNKALRAVVMQLLAEFVKEIIRKLISWFRKSKKTIETLLDSIKSAVTDFVNNLKRHLFNAGTTILTTVATAIFGPIVRTVRKVITMLKQGIKSLGEAVKYLRNPENKRNSVSVLLLEVGKIVVTGASAAGALALGEVIEKGLMLIPVFAFEIPILGSLASLVGLLLGGIVMGILGAIVLNLIDRIISKRLNGEATKEIIEKQNRILNIQQKQQVVAEQQLENSKSNAFNDIIASKKLANEYIENHLRTLPNKACVKPDDDTIVITENSEVLSAMQKELENLL